ncbi:MAG TPA: 6-bladed beta-propeller [Gemmatimonadales bacterium]|jgi:hypothetical protein
MRHRSVLALSWLMLAACGGETADTSEWRGTVDTLPSGRVVVRNPSTGVWDQGGTPWQVDEVVRIGALDVEGPAMLGQVTAVEADAQGRLWVFEGQAQELRVFDTTGAHVRTIGRRGGGPGEFEQVIGMGWGPDGNLWLLDPSNNRFTLVDTVGTVVTTRPAIGGWVMMPWPGRFDDQGFLYTYVPNPDQEDGGIVMVRFDTTLTPLDTIVPPSWQGEENYFEKRSEDSWMRAAIPYSAGLVWRLAPSGRLWFALTGEYRIFEMTADGDTILEISRDFDPLPVTSADVDSAVAGLEWFVRQGGKVDRTRFPSTKPPVRQFFVDDRGRIWVASQEAGAGASRWSGERASPVLDVFDPDGRYLGKLTLPFPLSIYPTPVFRGDMVYAVSRDELDVPYVVAARIRRTVGR